VASEIVAGYSRERIVPAIDKFKLMKSDFYTAELNRCGA